VSTKASVFTGGGKTWRWWSHRIVKSHQLHIQLSALECSLPGNPYGGPTGSLTFECLGSYGNLTKCMYMNVHREGSWLVALKPQGSEALALEMLPISLSRDPIHCKCQLINKSVYQVSVRVWVLGDTVVSKANWSKPSRHINQQAMMSQCNSWLYNI
jgi:hypothetical protein